MTNQKNIETLLLVDGNALVHRGFHAIPHLSTKAGEPTNGVYGFALLFLNALKEIKPEYVVVSFDLPEPTFRDKLYDEYKAGRVAAPDELYEQIPRVKDLVRAFNIPIYEKAGFEADDIIGTIAKQADHKKLKVMILTGDYDTLQLVNHNIKVVAPKKGLTNTQIYGEKEVVEKYKLTPDQLIDYKSLRGDPSDNIPGVSGIGEKTATELLLEFETLEKIYKYLESHSDGGNKIKPRIAKLLTEQEDQAKLSKKLATIVCDVPVKFFREKARLSDYDESKVVKIFKELEFRSLVEKIPKSESRHTSGTIKERQNHSYHLIDTVDKFTDFFSKLKKQTEIALDTETTSERPMQAELVGIGMGWEEGEAYYIPSELLKERDIEKNLKSVLEHDRVKKVGQNIKYDYLVLKNFGIELKGVEFDTMIAAYLLNPGARAFDLDTLAFTEFGYRMTPTEELLGPRGKKQKTMADVPVAEVSDYCCEDVDYTWRLKQKLEKELKDKPRLWKLFREIEVPLLTVLADMEFFGILVNLEILKKLSGEAEKEIKKIEKKIYSLAGEEFNIGSPIQLKEILFEKLEIPTEGLKKGKTGFSTAATELEKLRGLHPIVELISDWREVSKLQNTYLDALPGLVNPSTDRIHTSFNQTIAATGRLSSSDPNLQNIPVRTDLGKRIREAFVAKSGFTLVSIDYSQIELRIAAHLSQDKKMIKVFQANEDIHTATAEEIGVSRRQAKVINFGILYGLSAYGLTSRIPDISREEAAEFIDKYKSAYPQLIEYLHEIILTTRKQGYVTNELGRIRNLPEINSSQFQVRSAAERAAINMPLQSLAADIIKLAMNQLQRDKLTTKDDCRLLLQVHDELVFEMKTTSVKKYVPRIAKIMESVYKLKVPLLVDAKGGESWGKMLPIE